MKNNFFLFLFFIFFICIKSFAEDFKFLTEKIDVVDNGNLIKAINGKAISIDKDIEINASKFEYKKDTKILTAFNGEAIIKSNNIKINFFQIIIDQKNLTVKGNQNIEVIDLDKNLFLKTESLFFDRKKNYLESDSKSKIKDNENNILNTEYFFYDLNKGIIKTENLILKDFNNDTYKIEIAFINAKTNKLFGKDVEINFDKNKLLKRNEPRLKGKSITSDKNYTELTKGVFTNCKKREKCPPWQMSAKKIIHDKNKKTIKYDSSVLRVYDVPIFYFPKFFHPDPTVKRQSGFLIPAIKSSSNDNSFLSTPYFYAISESKDMTLTPRFYSSDKFLLQTEYRSVTSNSKTNTDISFFTEKNKNSSNHLFYNLEKDLNFQYFDQSNLELIIEKTSNDTYLRANKLESPIINEYSVLENSFNLNMYSDDFAIDTQFTIYENLDKDKTDRYEYILPELNISKKFENKTSLDGTFVFNSKNLFKNYDTNVSEKININDLVFNSNPKISNNGFYSNYEFIIKNSNSDANNSGNYKNKENYYLGALFQYNTSLPLVKENTEFQNILSPKISLKIGPDHTKDKRDSFTRLDVNNIYGLNRLASDDALEGGLSVSYGSEFTRINKENSREDFVFKIANNIRLEENEDLPKNNQIGLKTSNLFGEIILNPNDFFSTEYKFSTKNNLNDFTYESINTSLNFNKFRTSFDYVNENDKQDKVSYLLSEINFDLDENNTLLFSSRENKEKDLTEYYNLMYQYKNDCLAASIEYNKNYYEDRDIKPEENIFFKLTIIPFGEVASTPNLKE